MVNSKIPVDLILKNLAEEADSVQKRMGKAADVLLGDLSADIPGEMFREFIRDCFQQNLLIQNKMEVGGTRVDLKKLTMPLLNIYGKFDHLVPPEACELLTDAVGSEDTEDICLKTGHIGIHVSSRCQQEFTPKITQWLAERDEQPIKKRRSAAGTAKSRNPKASRKNKVVPG